MMGKSRSNVNEFPKILNGGRPEVLAALRAERGKLDQHFGDLRFDSVRHTRPHHLVDSLFRHAERDCKALDTGTSALWLDEVGKEFGDQIMQWSA